MRQARLYRYSVPMTAGIVLRNQSVPVREGLVVCLREGDQEGWGEIAPLPILSRESLDEAQTACGHWLAVWQSGASPADSVLPSVAFGLSCAQAELQGLLPSKANYQKSHLCKGDMTTLYRILQAEAHPLGKIKVGVADPITEGRHVSQLLQAIPRLTLRLDANQSWTVEQALDFAQAVDPAVRERIAFLEEPCADYEASRTVARISGLSIAWDERVRETGFCVEAEAGVAAIVIKPTLVGSLQRCRHLIAEAHRYGMTAVISSSLESSLGLTQLARIAAWLTPQTVPGLDTLDIMQAQVLRLWPESALPLLGQEALTPVWPA